MNTFLDRLEGEHKEFQGRHQPGQPETLLETKTFCFCFHVFMFLCLWWNKHLGLTSKQCDGPALDKTFPSFNFLRPESFYSSFDFKVLGKDLLSLNSVMMPLMINMKKLIRLMMMMIKMRASWPFYFPQRVAPKIGADSSAVGHSHTLAEI